MKKKMTFTALVIMFSCGLFLSEANAQQKTFTFPYKFSTEDIYGKRVTERSLGEKELYFVHYLATWCPPCVREMPELAYIARKYGDRVGFIGLLDDYDTNKDAAIRLAEKAGIPFILIDAEHHELWKLLEMVQSGYVPTTILIGRDGKVIGEQIVGSYGLDYIKFIDKALSQSR